MTDNLSVLPRRSREISVRQAPLQMSSSLALWSARGRNQSYTDTLDLNLGVQINSVKQPIKSNSVGSGYVSHCWTSAFNDHFNHGFVILKNVQHRTKSRKLRVQRDVVNITQIKIVVMNWNLGLVLGVLV